MEQLYVTINGKRKKFMALSTYNKSPSDIGFWNDVELTIKQKLKGKQNGK